jgi:hypothetical protein
MIEALAGPRPDHNGKAIPAARFFLDFHLFSHTLWQKTGSTPDAESSLPFLPIDVRRKGQEEKSCLLRFQQRLIPGSDCKFL